MDVNEARENRAVRFALKRVGVDPKMLDELDDSRKRLLMCHHLLSVMNPEVHDDFHREAINRMDKDRDYGFMRPTVEAGICIELLIDYMFASLKGIDRLNLEKAQTKFA